MRWRITRKGNAMQLRKLALVVLSALCLAASVATAGETLKLSHVLDRSHPYHKVIENFAKRVNALTNGQIRIRVHPNGELGWNRETLELLQDGSIAFTQANVSLMEGFAKEYSVFSLPYLFENSDQFYKAIVSPVGRRVLESSAEKGLVGIAFHDNNKRSFYGKKAYRSPDDLKGQKIRIMPSPIASRMIELMGGSPVVIPFGEIYTALQQGVADGAESNPSVLTTSRHGEVAKFFSRNEHTMPPDVLVMSKIVWDRLSEENRKAIQQAADESVTEMAVEYTKAVEEAEKEAREKMGVEFIEVDKKPFIDAVQPIYDDLKKNEPELYKLVEALRGK